MKIFAALFSVYVLMLSLAPCTDTFFGEHNHDHNETQLVDERHTGDENSGVDDCSPFCHCHCCHTPVIETPSIQTAALIAQQPTQITFYIGKIGVVSPHPIFQPPRV